jgi:hypothetical protein
MTTEKSYFQPAPQRLPLAQLTAPRKIWLQSSGVEFDMAEPFPDNHEGITWCEDEIGDGDVPYVRADLATPPDLLEIVRISIGNIRSLGPAGALAQVYTPYREWLAQLESAYAKATGEQA